MFVCKVTPKLLENKRLRISRIYSDFICECNFDLLLTFVIQHTMNVRRHIYDLVYISWNCGLQIIYYFAKLFSLGGYTPKQHDMR